MKHYKVTLDELNDLKDKGVSLHSHSYCNRGRLEYAYNDNIHYSIIEEPKQNLSNGVKSEIKRLEERIKELESRMHNADFSPGDNRMTRQDVPDYDYLNGITD